MTRISRKQEKAILALMTARTIEGAAKRAGVYTRTIFRWFKSEAFLSEYRDARREVITKAISKAQSSMSKAVDALVEVLEDRNCPPSARVAASRDLLAISLRGLEVLDFQCKLLAIENRIISEGNNTRWG